jgi:hypothetical protein
MNKFGAMLIAFSILVTFISLANARPAHRFDATTNTCRDLSNGQADWDSRPWGEGGKLFRKVCKSCHTRNNNLGAPFLWVESKTSKGWNRVFYKKYPNCAKNNSWKSIDLEQQLKLNDYLYRFAANSHDANDSA